MSPGSPSDLLPLFFSTMSYQMVLYCWTVNRVTNVPLDAVLAFAVIGFLVLLVAFILQVEMSFADLKDCSSPAGGIAATVLQFVGALCVLVQLIVYGAKRPNFVGPLTPVEAYGVTVYAFAIASSIISGVLLLLGFKGGCSGKKNSSGGAGKTLEAPD